MSSSPPSPKRAKVTAEGRSNENENAPKASGQVDASDNASKDNGELSYRVISNDGDPKHMEMLITLKNIFARQLPKMPKDYIVRLVRPVFDVICFKAK